MNLKKFKLIFLVLFILLSTLISAVTITTEPEELFFENVLVYGYAEKIVKINSDSTEPIRVSLSATEPIEEWMNFESYSAYASKGSPAEFKVVVHPPEMPVGQYQGFIIINVLSEGADITTAMVTAISLEITVDVTDEQIIQARIKDVVVRDIKENNSINILVEIENEGNVDVESSFKIDILDRSKGQILKSLSSKKKRLPSSSTQDIKINIPNDLALGAYWAEIKILLDDDWIIGKRLVKFRVIEDAELPVEQEPVILAEEEPIILSLNLVILVLWAVILIFFMWIIDKSKPGKQK